MRKRIAFIEADRALASAIAGKQPEEIICAPLEKIEDLPSGITALAFDAKQLDQAMPFILAVGEEYNAILNLLADAIGVREGIAFGSSERVRQHATRFAQALGLSANDQLILERGALLRDVGKMRVPNDILLKKSVLDYDEWTLLHAHTTLGADLLEERGVCADLADVIRCHHECYDGDGYPDHLEREAIPYFARIMKILDVYCAMTSPRHYRKTVVTHADALAHVKSERGKHFDPELVDVFLDSDIAQPAEAS